MRVVSADIKRENGKLNRYFSKCVGAGRAGEVMRYKAFEQLKKIQCQCPFEYIRFHGLFHEEMAIVTRDEDGKLIYNFQYVDLLFDSLLDIGLRPIVELGLMPKTMGTDDRSVFWWKMNITPAKDVNEWKCLVQETVRHFTYRYGEDEIRKWYFEVWNEPNHPAFFTESKNISEYFKLYDAAAIAIKEICPDYKVGGPASAGLMWIPEIIEHCRSNNVPLDFVSSHNYCVRGAFDADGKSRLYIHPVEHMTDRICESAKVCHDEGLPFIITEWSASYSSRDRIHDSYFSAPFILEAIKRCEGDVDMFSYWVYTDIFEEVGVPLTPFHGGFGLMNIQSLPKPTYYAFTFLSRLGDTKLACDDRSTYICKNRDEIQILTWNLVHPDTQGKGNNEYFGKLLPSIKKEDIQIELCGLDSCANYAVTVETIGYKMGDVYSEYLEGCYSELPTREETAKLLENSKPQKSTFYVSSDESCTLKFTLPQTENQVDFITVKLQ